ncbi:hypothetical protein A2U01_0002558, partial [Trifolium medium]|nr:hypothetical protein [Trifolium medium]
MMLSQAILPPQLLHLNRKHRVLPTTSLNCRRKILPSRIMSSKAVLPPTVANFSLLADYLANSEAADVYEQLNRNITTAVLTKLGFSKEDISRLTHDEISHIMELGCLQIPNYELSSIITAEVYKLPTGKHKRFVKAVLVHEFPFAKFLVDLLIPTNPRDEEDKESVPSAAHAPLRPQQTHRFLSIVVPLGLTCVFGVICFISSKMKKGGHPVTPAIDVAHDLQIVETDDQ